MNGQPAEVLLRRHRRFGWSVLALALGLGAVLEALLAMKAAPYLEDPVRREFWTLAHSHAGLLALINLVYAALATRGSTSLRRGTSWALLAGSVLMPVGFFLGGLSHPEGDPGVGVLLAPPGGLCVLAAVVAEAWAAWRDRA